MQRYRERTHNCAEEKEEEEEAEEEEEVVATWNASGIILNFAGLG